MNGLFSNSALIIVYAGVLLVGLALVAGAIVSLLRSFTPGRQSRPKAASRPVVSRAATYSLGLGAIVFGAAGLLAQLLFHLDPATGVIVALGLGLVVSLIAMALLAWLPARGQALEALIDFDATGRRARVVIPIPANGLGEITFRNGDEVVNLGARSALNRAIAAGETVVIDRVTQRIAVVTPLAEGSPLI